jgi:hypothetical protein
VFPLSLETYKKVYGMFPLLLETYEKVFVVKQTTYALINPIVSRSG